MKYIIGILIIIAIAVGIGYGYGNLSTYFANSMSPGASPTSSENPNGTSLAPQASTTENVSPTTRPVIKTATPKPLPETRLTFTKCEPSNPSLRLKADTRFILENLDYSSRKISVGDVQTFILQPQATTYAYARPLGILSVSCDGAGVGTLFVEK